MSAKINLTGTKLLIAAGALAGTVGGWILFSMAGGGSAAGSGPVWDPAVADLLTRPLPTLAPWNTPLPGTVGNSAGASIILPTEKPALRSVSAQPDVPASAAITKSSK